MVVDAYGIGFVLAGALFAGFTTGLAGFGTGLVAAGFWFHVLPAGLVPPMIAMGSVAGQWVGLVAVKRQFDWPRAAPFLIGGVLGVPLGVLALAVSSPTMLRTLVGCFLTIYAVVQISGLSRHSLTVPQDKRADGLIGLGGGFLGGFAGLSGILPLIWLQLSGGPSAEQRAIYQPFNMVVLALSSVAMWLGGQFPPGTWLMLAIAVPGIAVGAFAGARFSTRVSEAAFRMCVLCLLLGSGVFLVGRALF